MKKAFITYDLSENAWNGYQAFVEKVILDNGYRTICEVGGGANPTLPLEFVNTHGLDYVIMDKSEEELTKGPAQYRKVQADIMGDGFPCEGGYDLVFSKMLAEHVKSGEKFHRNIFRLLRQGGRSVHFFPTLYAAPFVVNYMLPERFGYVLLNLVQPGRDSAGKHAKFPAYYSWCRGPSGMQIARLRSVGYEVERYIGFFGHAGYYRKVPLLQSVHERFSRWLVRHPVSYLTSFSWLVLVKP